MKKIMSSLVLIISLVAFTSCEKDEGKLPDIQFKSGGIYVSSNDSLDVNAAFTIGINAKKTEDKDGLKKFNISKSVDGGVSESVFSKDLSGGEEDNYNYDFTSTMPNSANVKTEYTFTVTNRDGLSNTVSIRLISK